MARARESFPWGIVLAGLAVAAVGPVLAQAFGAAVRRGARLARIDPEGPLPADPLIDAALSRSARERARARAPLGGDATSAAARARRMATQLVRLARAGKTVKLRDGSEARITRAFVVARVTRFLRAVGVDAKRRASIVASLDSTLRGLPRE